MNEVVTCLALCLELGLDGGKILQAGVAGLVRK
jgi:hypothetical protein